MPAPPTPSAHTPRDLRAPVLECVGVMRARGLRGAVVVADDDGVGLARHAQLHAPLPPWLKPPDAPVWAGSLGEGLADAVLRLNARMRSVQRLAVQLVERLVCEREVELGGVVAVNLVAQPGCGMN